MSYARFSDTSDVYIYESARGLECCGCRLDENWTPVFTTYSMMLEHLNIHLRHGHMIPEHVFEDLTEEMIEFGDEVGAITIT